MNRLIKKSTLLLLTLLFADLGSISAQNADTEETRLEHAASIFYDGTNAYEFHKAIENYRNYLKAKGDDRKYYTAWEKEIRYDVFHGHFHDAIKKMQLLKNELKEAKAEEYYYLVDYLMGLFYGMRENNELSKEYLKKAAEQVETTDNNEALILIYQTLANISIFRNLEEGYGGYSWAEKAMSISKTPQDLCSSLSLKAMVAIGHDDKPTFDKCYQEILKIREDHPDQSFTNYRKYIILGRAAFDGNYDMAIQMCDSIRDEVGRLYFLFTIYDMKGDLQSQRDALLELLKAKDRRSDAISRQTINDINEEFQLEKERLSAQKTKHYVVLAIAVITFSLVLAILLFIYLRWRRRS